MQFNSGRPSGADTSSSPTTVMPLNSCPSCQAEMPAGTLFCPQCGYVDPAAAAAEARSASTAARRKRDPAYEWIAALVVITAITLWGVRVGKAAENDEIFIEAPQDSAAEQRIVRRSGGGGGAGVSSGRQGSANKVPRVFCPYVPANALASPGQESLFQHCRDSGWTEPRDPE